MDSNYSAWRTTAHEFQPTKSSNGIIRLHWLGNVVVGAGFVMLCEITYAAVADNSDCIILNILKSWNQYILELFRGAHILQTKTAIKK